MKIFAKGRSRVLGAVALALFCGGGFAATTFFNVARFGNTHIPAIQSFRLDAHIPFISSWVWVYLLYYPFCFLPLFLREVRMDPKNFARTIMAYGLQFGISFAFFVFWPLRMIHPIVPAGINGVILQKLYSVDLGFSSFPSLHLANIVFVSLLFLRLKGARKGIVIFGVTLLIAVSTLLIKQHFISDVIAGAFLGWGSFVLSFGLPSNIIHMYYETRAFHESTSTLQRPRSTP